VPITYFGRQIHYPGFRDTSGNKVQVTFISDNNWRVYKEMFHWHNEINEWLTNHNNLKCEERSQYKTDMTVRLKNSLNKDTLVFKFVGVWPSEITGFSLDWNENKSAEFQTTFIFDYVAIVQGNGVDTISSLIGRSVGSAVSAAVLGAGAGVS
jgi:hypothetical protein